MVLRKIKMYKKSDIHEKHYSRYFLRMHHLPFYYLRLNYDNYRKLK